MHDGPKKPLLPGHRRHAFQRQPPHERRPVGGIDTLAADAAQSEAYAAIDRLANNLSPRNAQELFDLLFGVDDWFEKDTYQAKFEASVDFYHTFQDGDSCKRFQSLLQGGSTPGRPSERQPSQ